MAETISTWIRCLCGNKSLYSEYSSLAKNGLPILFCSAIMPNLIAGRPVILTGRYTGSGRTNITVKGKTEGCEKTISIEVDLSDPKSSHKGIASVWARKKIESLATRSTYDSNTELPELITSVALEFNLMSKYTSFVAVDSSRKTAGDHGISVVVPVPVPDGVKYETTVQN